MRFLNAMLAVIALALLLGAGAVDAAVVSKKYDFALDSWHDMDAADGPVTLHRMRLDVKEGRLTKSTLTRVYNSEYLETVRIQLEYTNESSGKWNARVTVRWRDAEGRVIDGFSANESLEKKSARKIAQVSLSTLKYGLARAKTLEVEIHYEP